VGKEDIYKNKEKKLVLASLSELYFKLNVISVDVSGYSSCPTSHYLLTTLTIDYCPKNL